MTLRELYEASIEIGREVDPRGREALDRQLEQRRQEYAALPDWRKPYYDRERFNNPYGDVRIVNGPEDTVLNTILMGVNIGTQELLLADNLRGGGTRIDAVISHHTNGIGVPADTLIYDTVPYLVDLLEGAGVARADAEPHITDMMTDRWNYAEDFNRNGIDMAKLLEFPLACIHTPADFHHGQGVRGAIEAPMEKPLVTWWRRCWPCRSSRERRASGRYRALWQVTLINPQAAPSTRTAAAGSFR